MRRQCHRVKGLYFAPRLDQGGVENPFRSCAPLQGPASVLEKWYRLFSTLANFQALCYQGLTIVLYNECVPGIQATRLERVLEDTEYVE